MRHKNGGLLQTKEQQTLEYFKSYKTLHRGEPRSSPGRRPDYPCGFHTPEPEDSELKISDLQSPVEKDDVDPESRS
jgi:hypothetical protein